MRFGSGFNRMCASAARHSSFILARRRLGRLRLKAFQRRIRACNHMGGDEFAHASGGRGTCVHRNLYRGDISVHKHRHEAEVGFLFGDEADFGRFHGGVGRLDEADKSARLDHAKRL